MIAVVGVHGVGHGSASAAAVAAVWSSALTGGLQRAELPASIDVSMAFYADLFVAAGKAAGWWVDAAARDAWMRGLTDVEIDDLELAASEVVSAAELALVGEVKGLPGVPAMPRRLLRWAAAIDRRYGHASAILFFGVLYEVRRYLFDPVVKRKVDARVDEAAPAGCAVMVGHSLGSVVAREWVRRHPGRARLLVTLGSPLGLRMVRDRLTDASDGLAQAVGGWVNVFDPRDPVACVGGLQPFWSRVVDEPVTNPRGDVHSAAHYLGQKATAAAVGSVLGTRS